MTALPDWMRPPRPEGWLADDLDHLPDAPPHTELVDGALDFRTWPQQGWHRRTVASLTSALTASAPTGLAVTDGTTVRLNDHDRVEPDVLVATADVGSDGTWYDGKDVVLVVEVSQAETAYRDRTVKFRKYADTGIPHYWLVDRDDDVLTVHVYELRAGRSYAATRIERDVLQVDQPFSFEVEVRTLMS